MMDTQLRVLSLGRNGMQMACKSSRGDVLIPHVWVMRNGRLGVARSQLTKFSSLTSVIVQVGQLASLHCI